MKKSITMFLVLMLLFSSVMPAYAAQEDTYIGVYAGAEYHIEGEYRAALTAAAAEVTTSDNVSIRVTGAPDTAVTLVVYPIPSADTEAWDWITASVKDTTTPVSAYDIFFRDNAGNRMNADGAKITISHISAQDAAVVCSLTTDSVVCKLTAATETDSVSFEADGSHYYVLGKKPEASDDNNKKDDEEDTETPDEHQHSYTETITKQPTCTETGIKTCTCSCGNTYTVTIAELGHHYVSRVTTAPTTQTEGVMTYTCERCGHSYTKPIAKLTEDTGDDNTGTEREPGIPFIENHPEKNGWDIIKDELEDAKEKDTVTVDMNGSTVVPENIFEEIKGRDITVIFDMGDGITWTVNGKDITSDNVGDIDFGVTTGSEAGKSIPIDVINNVTGERYSMNLTLAYDGEFGFTAILTLNLESKNAGYYANLFYYHSQNNALEYVCADEIDAEGNARLTFTHASDYIIVIDDEDMGNTAADMPDDGNDSTETGADENSPQTGDVNAWRILWFVVLCAMVMVTGFGVFFVRKRKEEGES